MNLLYYLLLPGIPESGGFLNGLLVAIHAYIEEYLAASDTVVSDSDSAVFHLFHYTIHVSLLILLLKATPGLLMFLYRMYSVYSLIKKRLAKRKYAFKRTKKKITRP